MENIKVLLFQEKAVAEILDMHEIMQRPLANVIMAYDKIMLKSKDFEGIYVTT